MRSGDQPRRWVGEDELLLADMEGVESARATAAYGRHRRRRVGLERWGQLERIQEVFMPEDEDRDDDVRLRVLYTVIGYVHEQVWREAIADIGRQVLSGTDHDERRTLRELRVNGDRVRPVALNDESLFLSDGEAVSAMSRDRREATALAQAYLDRLESTLVARREHAHPNPYQNLWLIEPLDPDHPGEVRHGDGPLIVLADGDVYELGSLPPRPPEMIGAILPPQEEWN